jgi:CRISPR-associated protein Cmr6
MARKKNTFKSAGSLGLFSGSGKPTRHKKNSGSGEKSGSKPGSDAGHGKYPMDKRDNRYTDPYPRANIGWLFAVDYYKDIVKIKKMTSENQARCYEEKNKGITGKQFSSYNRQHPILLISCKSMQKKQAFEMRPPRERHQADREAAGAAGPFLKMGISNIHGFALTLMYPGLLTGSGIPHESNTEGEFKIGFSFDHTTGLPVIPGSSVKGLLRSAFQQAEGEYVRFLLGENSSIDIEALEHEIFQGETIIQGKKKVIPLYKRDIFFDAAMIEVKNKEDKFLAEDYITPHPSPFKNPVPLLFLKVLPRVTFLFQFRLHTGMITAEEKKLLFEHIIRDLGIGAKTNVGYGKFLEKGGG